MSATSAHHALCAPIAEWHACCFTFFQTVQLLLCTTLFTLTAALRPWSYRFVCDARATHSPCQLNTRLVSSKQIHMSMVYTPLFTSSLMTVRSRWFRMRRFFSSSTTTLPACTTFLIEVEDFTTFALLIFLHLCTPSTDLNGMDFSPKSSISSPFPATNFFVVVVRSSYARGNISVGTTCIAAPVSIVVLMFTQLSLISMIFLGDARSNRDPLLRSIHLCLFPCTLRALQVQMFLHTLLRMFPHHRLLQPRRSPLVRSCHFSSLGC